MHPVTVRCIEKKKKLCLCKCAKTFVSVEFNVKLSVCIYAKSMSKRKIIFH